MKNSAVAIVLAALLIMIVIGLGAQMSDQTIAVLSGAACGVGLAGPLGFALGVLVGISRARNSPSHSPPSPPHVIVVPPPPAAPSTSHPSGYMPAQSVHLPPARSFTIIGDDDTGE